MQFLYVGVLLRNANTAFSSDGAVGDSQLPKLSIEQKISIRESLVNDHRRPHLGRLYTVVLRLRYPS